MPKNITQYDLLISCPGDITEEIDIINNAVRQFNDLYSDHLGISVRTKHWSKNSYPQSGGKAQALLNEQFVKDCDLAVALFWTRFGSPTDEYGSGTEEEIEIMLDAGKQVFLYFSEIPQAPFLMDNDGYKKIQAFKDKYKDRGIYRSYNSIADFEGKFFADLTKYFILKKESDDKQLERNSQLVLRGIGANRCLSENCVDFSKIDDDFYENVATCDDSLLEKYLDHGEISEHDVQHAIIDRKTFPVYFGSALKLTGIKEFLAGFEQWTLEQKQMEEFAARCFKISHDKNGERLTWVKILGGKLKAKTELSDEKINQIRSYNGEKFTTITEAEAGDVVALTGLTSFDL